MSELFSGLSELFSGLSELSFLTL
ncbi:hypothetical protein [Methanosarcina sp. 1.H.A.2.2]